MRIFPVRAGATFGQGWRDDQRPRCLLSTLDTYKCVLRIRYSDLLIHYNYNMIYYDIIVLIKGNRFAIVTLEEEQDA